MQTQLHLGDISVDVIRKDIKNVHLSVHPPTGRISIAAPSRMSLDTIRVFAISKIGWINQQRRKLHNQDRESPREYLNRESHYYWGKRLLLEIHEADAPLQVTTTHRHLILQTRPGSNAARREAVVEAWYRDLVKTATPSLIKKWEPIIGVKVQRFFVQRMKTKWGSCNHSAGTIRLNSELAKKPRECLEYLIVHEMIHLLEPTHNARFRALIEEFMPRWQFSRDLLNSLPLRHEDWIY